MKNRFRHQHHFHEKLGEKLVLHLNLGYTFIGEHYVDNELNYSLAAQFILTKKWALAGEVVRVNNLNGRHGDDPISGLLGTITSLPITSSGMQG